MGKPYQSEVSALPKTISWALSVDIKDLVSFVSESHGTPLIATGSGGSLSAAKLAAVFHQLVGAGFSKSITPLELASIDDVDRSASFLLLSAGGSNTDIRMVFEHLALKGLRRVAAVIGRIGSPILKLSEHYSCSRCVELAVPTGQDGFLATNSLIAFSIALARAYAAAQKSDLDFRNLRHLTADKSQWGKHIKSLEMSTSPLWRRWHLIVLYSPELEAAATDLESKFTEAALGTTQIADYRHFAHGRHNWLAKRSDDCAVVALFTPRFQRIAEQTLHCFPKSIPVVRAPFSGDLFEMGVHGILTSILLAGFAGKQRGIDPGRPGVPEFGRKIYHLKWVSEKSRQEKKFDPVEAGVQRKLETIGKQLRRNSLTFSLWLEAGDQFCRRLAKQILKGVVLDFDGTVVSTNQRFDPVPRHIAGLLSALLRNGLYLGFASGRGKSLRQALEKFIPPVFRPRVVLGYYNGSQTGLLSDDHLPEKLPPIKELSVVHDALAVAVPLVGGVKMEARHSQLSLVPTGDIGVEQLWNVVSEVLAAKCSTPIRVVRSGHSVDVTVTTVTKRAVVERIRNLAGAEICEVLCIGDKGRPPGNDSDLLKTFPSLSVDEVSSDPETCWNITPAGCAGPDALVAYLSSLTSTRLGFVFDPARMKRTIK